MCHQTYQTSPPDTTRRPGEVGVITPTVITPTYTYDCAGWVFTCGEGGEIPMADVDKIISDNDYAPVTSTHYVHVGALVVYRNQTNTPTHVAVVREVQSDGTRSTTYCNYGMPTLLESKWSDLGQYKHPPDAVPPDYLPPGGSITYYHTSQARRKAAQNKPDPGKQQHTLNCGCLGLECFIPFFVIWFIRSRKRNQRGTIKKLLMLSLAILSLSSFYIISCTANYESYTENKTDRQERRLRLEEKLKIIKTQQDPEFVKRLNQVNELLDKIEREPYLFFSLIYAMGDTKPEGVIRECRPLIENSDIALPLMFERLDAKKVSRDTQHVYFIVFGETKSAESIPYIFECVASVSEEETKYLESVGIDYWAARRAGADRFVQAIFAAKDITHPFRFIDEHRSFYKQRLAIANKLNQWYKDYRNKQGKK
ncbi:MAG: CHAP domain-containing protein [Planctomycetota bacterium]|nr:CHAP domain-containing protein [Planctomycetota bacterium]MDI6788008.1 CHAP domain-containing protein [Planctomycetota bacterium]